MQVITVFSAVWRTQRLVLVCGTTLLDNQLFQSRSFLLRMSSFRYVVLVLEICHADDRPCVDNARGCVARYRETEKRLQHSELADQRTRYISKRTIVEEKRIYHTFHARHTTAFAGQANASRSGEFNTTASRRPRRRPCPRPYRLTHPHPHPLPSYYAQLPSA